MAKPWIKRIGRIAIGMAVIVALALPVTLPDVTTAVVTKIAQVIPPLSVYLVIAIAVEAALVILVASWWLWWQLPRRQVTQLALKIRDPKARADVEDNFRKTVGQVLGGAAVLIGAVAAYLQFLQQQQASRQQLQAAHDLLISNQVSKGFEQLVSDKLTMRLGGIYGLEGVMNASAEYHQPVLEVLCAFVRDGTIGMIVNDRPTTDIQAALTVIGRSEHRSGSVNLAQANIPNADLQRANLSDADLSGVNLSGARLSSVGTHSLFPPLNFEVDIKAVSFDWKEIRFSAKLSGADLSDANLSNATLILADLHNANLAGAYLNGADLSLANLRNANLAGAHLDGTDLSGADLSGAHDLTQPQLDKACEKPAALPGVLVKPAALPGGLKLDKPCPRRDPVAPALNRKTTP
jgi:Pentapeptide repeats (8 copies)